MPAGLRTPAPPHGVGPPEPRGGRPGGRRALAVLLAAPIAAATSDRPGYVPTAVQPALDRLAPGTRLLAEGDVTGWVLFAAPDTAPVFDLRIESYDPAYVRHFISAMDAEQGWDGFVRSTGAQAALLLEDSPLALALARGLALARRAAGPGLRAPGGGMTPMAPSAAPPAVEATPDPSPTGSQVRLGWAGFGLAMALGLVIGIGKFWEVDTWWHLSVGQHILDTHTLRGPDAWARFADRPYTATQWLPEAAAAWLVGVMGPGGVVLLRATSVLTLVVLLYVLGRLSAGRLTAGLVAAVALLGAGAGLNPRPQLVSFVLFAVTVLAWWRTAHDHRPRWWLVAVYWLWACSHGLWSIGLAVNGVLLAALVLDPRTRPDRRTTLRLGGLLAACTLAVAVTPLGTVAARHAVPGRRQRGRDRRGVARDPAQQHLLHRRHGAWSSAPPCSGCGPDDAPRSGRPSCC